MKDGELPAGNLIMDFIKIVAIFVCLTLVKTTATTITFPKQSQQEQTASEVFRPLEPGTPQSLAYHVASLGLKALRDLLPSDGSVILSPFNIFSSLGILSLGADGETKTEVLGPRNTNLDVIALADASDGVSYAAAMFLDKLVEPNEEFKNSALRKFQASIINVDMNNGEEAKNSINSWVSYHTNGTINNLLQEPLDPQTKMVVSSALLFKGKWLKSFSPEATTRGKFYVDVNKTVDVQLMHLWATLPVVRSTHLDALALPYQGKDMTLYLILPKAPGFQGLKSLLSHLNVNSLRKLRSTTVEQEVIVTIPKLKINGRYSLAKMLKQQGISAMFNPEIAKFGNLTKGGERLHVSDIYQSVHFETNEEGTTASAATASILTKAKKPVFSATKPFIILITNENDLVLFMGAVVRPE
ncbi:hypothetical protein RUM43_005370 [Polyplax serrata]|uniref:Serpin domain-containing protein n=1 Tax=Polyplax serrata TaxID=468196 RepID=A0AAN8PDG2_POLSC